MFQYTPVLGRPRLGQLDFLTSGLTRDVAEKIVAAADAPTRRIIRDERNKLVEGLIGILPFAALSGVSFVGTNYLVPADARVSKFVGYGISLASLGVGGLLAASKLSETPAPNEAAGAAPPLVEQTAKAIVDNAEPKIRAIVHEERGRAAAAAEAGLPFAAGGALALLASATLIPQESTLWKVVGYITSIGLVTLGAYVALEKERE